MGFKRTFDSAEYVQEELNVKYGSEISYCNKLAKLDEGVPYRVSDEKSGLVLGDDDLSDLYGFKCEDNVDTNARFSWIITSPEEDAESGEATTTTQSTLSHESPESDFPLEPVSPEDEVDWCEMSPRKLVPIGPDYQADIPECVKDKVSAIDHDEEQVMGNCIIPMPDSETKLCKIGKGREECICFDKGSIRCVQQHIIENREDLFKAIGYETCVNIGLCEMGEEVASKLTGDEEELFHEVVYSNPVSKGRDFWKHLKYAFPSRTMKEIVSYYFNVFILRRRAVQNRSRNLDVDSDDDEWQADYDIETPEAEVNVDEDSYMPYDFHSNVIYSRCPVRNREETDVGSYCDDLVDHSYSFDPCDSSILTDHSWAKNIDLLPTSNIIDEIFGQEQWDDIYSGK